MFYIYVLEGKDGEFYTGFTKDLKKRLAEHNAGLGTYTKRYAPWELIYYEACRDILDAERREKYIKTTQGRRLLKRRLKEFFFKQ